MRLCGSSHPVRGTLLRQPRSADTGRKKMSLATRGSWAFQGLPEHLGADASPPPPPMGIVKACGQAWLPLCPPLLQQEGTRHFQDRSLGCIWKSWQRSFAFSSILVSGGTAIWILFAVPWQGNASRIVQNGQGGDGSLCGLGAELEDSRPCSQALGWTLALPLTCWVTCSCHLPHLGFLTYKMKPIVEFISKCCCQNSMR